jgi:hypothetical protein
MGVLNIPELPQAFIKEPQLSFVANDGKHFHSVSALSLYLPNAAHHCMVVTKHSHHLISFLEDFFLLYGKKSTKWNLL